MNNSQLVLMMLFIHQSIIAKGKETAPEGAEMLPPNLLSVVNLRGLLGLKSSEKDIATNEKKEKVKEENKGTENFYDMIL